MWEKWGKTELQNNSAPTRIIERRKKLGVNSDTFFFTPSEENRIIEQQGTVNNRTFVLLNFRSIIPALTVYILHTYILQYTYIYDINHVILY